MTVAELIEELKKFPQNKRIEAWDGDYQYSVPVIKAHEEMDCVWLETDINAISEPRIKR